MNRKTILSLLHLYWLKKQRSNEELSKVRFECQRLIRKHRRHCHLKYELIAALLLLIENSLQINSRSVWSLEKNDEWWTRVVPLMTDQQFKDNFRLERSTVKNLLHQVAPYFRRNDTNYRLCIQVEKKVCCALYAMGSTAELRTIGHLFGIGKSTAGELLHEFCSILIELFFHRLVKFPTTNEEIKMTIDGFATKYQYPLCLGSLDGTHISVTPPMGFETDYFNYKKFYSIIMLAVVDSNLRFTYVNIGAPGRCNDASVYTRSNLADVIKNPIYENHFMIVNARKVQAHLIADSAFALHRTLMKPYPIHPDMPRENVIFNYRLSRCRCTVERGFGLLKNRFRLLHKKMVFNVENATNIAKAAAILHNICINSEDAYEHQWDVPHVLHKKPSCSTNTNDGIDVRQAVTQYFIQNPI